jgi:hypothetical protein
MGVKHWLAQHMKIYQVLLAQRGKLINDLQGFPNWHYAAFALESRAGAIRTPEIAGVGQFEKKGHNFWF